MICIEVLVAVALAVYGKKLLNAHFRSHKIKMNQIFSCCPHHSMDLFSGHQNFRLDFSDS
jgi:hypothetical protein